MVDRLFWSALGSPDDLVPFAAGSLEFDLSLPVIAILKPGYQRVKGPVRSSRDQQDVIKKVRKWGMH